MFTFIHAAFLYLLLEHFQIPGWLGVAPWLAVNLGLGWWATRIPREKRVAIGRVLGVMNAAGWLISIACLYLLSTDAR